MAVAAVLAVVGLAAAASVVFVRDGSSSDDEQSCAPGGASLAAYEWRTSAWDTPAAAADLIEAAEALCLSAVHVDVTGFAVDELRGDVETSLHGLLDAAADSSVQIEALAGDPWWASPEGLADASEILDGLSRVNAERDDAAIESLHLDVEPWGLEEWAELKSTLVVDYVEFVSDIVAVRDGMVDGGAGPLHLSFLVPYWFDGSNGEAPSVEIGGVADHPLQHLETAGLDDVTWIAMAYRDRAEGEGGIVDLLQEELALADSVGLALETAPVEPLHITFADETLADLDRELRAVLDATSSLDELMINDFEHLRELAGADQGASASSVTVSTATAATASAL